MILTTLRSRLFALRFPVAAGALLAVAATGCAARPPSIATSTTHTTSAERPVYRFDFVLTSGDATPPATTSFTLNLAEFDKGEVMVGRNVPLTTAAPGVPMARQDVGLKIAAQFRMRGDDVLLDVSTEMSTSEPPSIRKTTMRGAALAAPGRSVLVSSLDDDNRRFQLTVTPTKLR
jgi:hypothetical protein